MTASRKKIYNITKVSYVDYEEGSQNTTSKWSCGSVEQNTLTVLYYRSFRLEISHEYSKCDVDVLYVNGLIKSTSKSSRGGVKYKRLPFLFIMFN